MFGIRAYAGRLLTVGDDQAGAPPVAVMSYRLWQQRYGSDPSVIGAAFNLDEKPFTVVGITPPGFFGDRLRSIPPDFFLPLNTEPYVEADADLNKVDTYWLDLIGRIRPGAKPAPIEAEMRVELKQWLRSHWGDMSANDRTKFSEQILFLRPGGAGITSMRDEYEHWLQILMMVSAFVLLIVCANVANLMLVRSMERRRQISLSMALGAQASRLVRQALTESILLSLARRRGRSGDRVCGHAADSKVRVPSHGWHGRRTHQRLTFHACTALRLRRFLDHRSCLRHRSCMDGHTGGSY